MEGIEEYKEVVLNRFLNLPEEDKSVLRRVPETPIGDALGKLFPEMQGLFPRDVPVEQAPVQQPSMEQPQIKRAGLGSR